MENDFPYDNEVFETELYEKAKSTLNLILDINHERKVYIREITREEVNRISNMKAYAEMGY